MQGMRIKSHRPTVRMDRNFTEPTWKTGTYRPFYTVLNRPVSLPGDGAQEERSGSQKVQMAAKTSSESGVGRATKKVSRRKSAARATRKSPIRRKNKRSR